MSELENSVGIIIALLGVALVVSVVAERIGVPYVVALLLVAAPFDVPLMSFAPALLFVFLPALIFEAAWNIDAAALRRRWLPVAILAVPGVIVTAFIVGGGLALTGQMPFGPALLLGTILSATDPIAVIAVFRRLSVPTDLATVVEGESLFNDGAAIVFYGLVLGILQAQQATPTALGVAWSAVSVTAGGAAIGFFGAAVVARLLRGVDDVPLQVVATLVVAFGVYLLADHFHLSGIFAAVVGGIALRAFPRFPSPRALTGVDSFWSVLAFLANALVFLMMGLRIEFGRIVHEPLLLVLALVLVTVARLGLAFIALPLAGGIERGWRTVVALSGMRGALSIALAIGLPNNLAFRPQLVDTVFGVVFLTLVAQGLTIGPAISRLSLAGAKA